MKIFRLCKPYIVNYRLRLTIYIAIALVSTAISILSPYILGDFLDALVSGANMSSVLRFCLVFGGLNVLRILMSYATSILFIKMQTKMGYDLNMATIKYVQSLSLSYINRQDGAYLNKQINSDAVALVIFCITISQSIVTNAIMFIVPLVILLAMNWFVAVLLMAFLIVYVTLYFIFKDPLFKANFAFKEAQSKFFSNLNDQLKYIKLIKLNSIQPEMYKRADKGFVGLLSASVHSQKINYLYSGLDGFITTLAQIALFVIGGIQILTGNFTIGMFTIFSSYFSMMIGSSRYFFNLGANYQRVLVSYDRVAEILKQKLEHNGDLVLDDVQRIELRDVNFSYNSYVTKDDRSGSTRKILSNFSATFEKGKTYCISGENGSGKSTLISLIMGMYIDEYQGSIAYNGIDIKDIDMKKARRELLGVAEQETVLVNDTILYNLTFEDECLQDSISQALLPYTQALNMQDFITNTLDLTINDSNTNTSGGEKQKVSILKVLLKNPTVMIFDEPTSALDAEATDRFMNHLQRVKADKLIILITHDEIVKARCDEIIYVSRQKDHRLYAKITANRVASKPEGTVA